MSQPRPLRIALWCAVSSKAQASADKTSLADQEAQGRKFAEAVGGQVVQVYSVPGHTRDIIFWSDAEAAMPAYRQLRADVAAGAFDILHVVDEDRLGRDPALSNQVLSLVEKSGGEVYFATSPHVIGSKGIGHRYLFAIKSTRAGEMQQQRVYRHRAGMRGRVARGLPASNWPLCYTPIRDPITGKTGTAELNELAGALRLATRLFIAGDTYNAIRTALDASAWHPPNAERWAYSTVRKWFCRDSTVGTLSGHPTWQAHRCEQRSTQYPALWDERTCRAVLRERDRRRGRKSRRRHGSPVAGVVFCARCGARMVRWWTSNGRYPWLRCATHGKKSQTGLPCHPNNIRESAVMDGIRSWLALLGPEGLDAALEGITVSDDHQERLADLEQRIAALQQKRQRLALALASGNMTMDIYRSADDVLLGDVETLEALHSQVQQRIAALPDVGELVSAVHFLQEHVDTLFSLPPLECSTRLRNALLRVEVEAGRITFLGHVPVSPA